LTESNDKESTDFMDMLENLMPELKLEEITPQDAIIEELSIKLAAAEKNLEAVVKSMDSIAKLYDKQTTELANLKVKQSQDLDISAAANFKLAKSMMEYLSIDYQTLINQLIERGYISPEKITTRIKEHMEKTSEVAKFQKKVAALVEESINVDYENLEIDHETLVKHIDYGDLSEHMCYSTISDYLSFDPTDYWDSSDLAYNFEASDIAEYIDTEDVAGYVEVDLDDIAQKINVEEVALHIDVDELALSMSQNIDLDELAQKVKDLRGDA